MHWGEAYLMENRGKAFKFMCHPFSFCLHLQKGLEDLPQVYRDLASVYRGQDKNSSIRSHEEQYFLNAVGKCSTLMKSNRDSSSLKAAITIVAEHGWNALHGGENAGPAQQIKEVDPFAEEKWSLFAKTVEERLYPKPKVVKSQNLVNLACISPSLL